MTPSSPHPSPSVTPVPSVVPASSAIPSPSVISVPSVIPAKAGIQRRARRRQILVTEEPVTRVDIATRGAACSPRENPLTGLPAWVSAATPSPSRGEGACRRSSRTSSGLPTHPPSFPPGHAARLSPPVVLPSGRRPAQRSCQQPPIIYLFPVILRFAQNDGVPRGVTFQVVGGDCVGRRKGHGFPLTTGGNDRRRAEGDRRRTKGGPARMAGGGRRGGQEGRPAGRTEGGWVGRGPPLATVIPAKAGI